MGCAHGDVHWNELNTHTPEKAVAFYEKVMGWTIREIEMGTAKPYRLIEKDGHPIAGIFHMDGPDFEHIPNHWFTHFAVADIGAAVADATAAGCEVRRPPFEVDGVGQVAIVADCCGAVMGLVQPANPA